MRRRLGRFFRKAGEAGMDVPPKLKRAHQLMHYGNYAEAANLFAQLAKRAEGTAPERAPFLYLQSGRAFMLDGQIQAGMAELRGAITLLGSQQRYARLNIIGERILMELNQLGLKKEAVEIQQVIQNNLPAAVQARPAAPASKILPTHCPQCGAGLNPGEVEWLDESTAECDYCGSPVHAK